MADVLDQRRLHPRVADPDPNKTVFVPELSPVVDPRSDGLMTRAWLDWARRLTLRVRSGGGGAGDVVGPGGATPDAIAVYNGATGKIIKDSLTTIAALVTQIVNAAIAAILPGGTLPVGNLPAHHPTHEPGGTDPLAHAAWTNVANQFTQPQTVAQRVAISDAPYPQLFLNSNRVDLGDTQWLITTDGTALYCQPAGSDGVATGNTLIINRDGTASLSGRLTAPGLAYTDVTNSFAASNNFFGYQYLYSRAPAADVSLYLIDQTQPSGSQQLRVLNFQQKFQIWRGDDGIALLVLDRAGNMSIPAGLTAGAGTFTGNVGIAGSLSVNNGAPTLVLNNTGGGGNNKLFFLQNNQSFCRFGGLNDAGSAWQGYADFYRSGTIGLVVSAGLQAGGPIYEQNRATPMGWWVRSTSLGTYISGFTGNYDYCLIGKTLHINAYGTATLAAPAFVGLSLPFGMTCGVANALPTFSWNYGGYWRTGVCYFGNGDPGGQMYTSYSESWPTGAVTIGVSIAIAIS